MAILGRVWQSWAECFNLGPNVAMLGRVWQYWGKRSNIGPSGSAITMAPRRSARGRAQQHRGIQAPTDAQEDDQHQSSSISAKSKFFNLGSLSTEVNIMFLKDYFKAGIPGKSLSDIYVLGDIKRRICLKNN